MIVPHARDEQRFDPARYDRDAVRRELGVGPYDHLLLFGGTPRAHKGVVEVLEALDRLGDDRYKLALFGIGELAKLGQPGPPARALGRAAAVPALRRAGAARRRRRPLVRPPGPHAPGRPLPDAGEDRRCPRHGRALPGDGHAAAAAAHRCGRGPCARSRRSRSTSGSHRSSPIPTTPATAPGRAARSSSPSTAAKRCRERVAPWFEQLVQDPGVLPNNVDALVKAPRSLLAARSRATDRVDDDKGVPARVPGSRRWRAAPDEQYDLVVFWKQNDTSIYGRRQDMFLKYLQRTGRFGKIVHFDSPISPGTLARTYLASTGRADQRRLVVRQTLERLAHRPRPGQRDPPDVPLRRQAELAAAPPDPLGLPRVRQVGAGEARRRQPAHRVLGVPDQRRSARAARPAVARPRARRRGRRQQHLVPARHAPRTARTSGTTATSCPAAMSCSRTAPRWPSG